MFLSVLRFELAYWFRRPLTLLFFLVLLLMGFFSTASDAFLDVGGTGQIHRNAPFVLAMATAILTAFGQVITTAIAGTAVVRDAQLGTQELLYSTRMSKGDYLLGRFAGSTLVMLAIYVGLPIGLLIGTTMPWIDADKLGPITAWAAFQPFLIIAVPNVLFVSALLFAIGALTRKLFAVYVTGIAVLLVWQITQQITTDLDKLTLASAIDPFASTSITVITRYWSVAEKNRLLVPLSGALLLNRVLWIGLALALFALVAAAFRMRLPSGSRARRRQSLIASLAPAVAPRAPVVALRHDRRAWIRAALGQAAFHTRFIVSARALPRHHRHRRRQRHGERVVRRAPRQRGDLAGDGHDAAGRERRRAAVRRAGRHAVRRRADLARAPARDRPVARRAARAVVGGLSQQAERGLPRAVHPAAGLRRRDHGHAAGAGLHPPAAAALRPAARRQSVPRRPGPRRPGARRPRDRQPEVRRTPDHRRVLRQQHCGLAFRDRISVAAARPSSGLHLLGHERLGTVPAAHAGVERLHRRLLPARRRAWLACIATRHGCRTARAVAHRAGPLARGRRVDDRRLRRRGRRLRRCLLLQRHGAQPLHRRARRRAIVDDVGADVQAAGRVPPASRHQSDAAPGPLSLAPRRGVAWFVPRRESRDPADRHAVAGVSGGLARGEHRRGGVGRRGAPRFPRHRPRRHAHRRRHPEGRAALSPGGAAPPGRLPHRPVRGAAGTARLSQRRVRQRRRAERHVHQLGLSPVTRIQPGARADRRRRPGPQRPRAPPGDAVARRPHEPGRQLPHAERRLGRVRRDRVHHARPGRDRPGLSRARVDDARPPLLPLRDGPAEPRLHDHPLGAPRGRQRDA